MTNEPEAIAILKKLRYDLTACQVKVSEALRLVSALDLPDAEKHVCPHCSLEFPGRFALDEHRYVSHGDDVPEHWKEAERLAATEEEVDGGREDAD